MKMPIKDGFQVMREVYELKIAIRIIPLTGGGTPSEVLDEINSMGYEYPILKPISRKVIQEILEAL
jgi:YesN/AraC family two-component response regulator